MVSSRSTLAALAALLLPLASAVPCVQFDTAWNLYAFGGSSDVNLGANTTWGYPDDLWTTKIYIYNFGAGSWSTQSTSSVPSTLGNSRSSSVLDHDTNVVFTLSGNTLYQLDMSSVTTTANASGLTWQAVENPSFSTSGYTVTAAQASNHINYFGVPGTAAGSADLFVVHYAYFQPTAQSYPTQNGGATFPDTAGQAFSIPDAANSVPYQMVFVPNDFSDSYVVTHWTNPSTYSSTDGAPFATSLINTTQILPAPSSKDTNAAYAASPYALAQIDSSGNIYYMTNPVGGDFTVQSGASWQKMSYSLSGAGSGSSSSSNSSTSAGASGSGSASKTASATKSGSSSSSAASASASKAAAGKAVRTDALGLAIGVVAVAAGAML
ncbi:hypothetical protein JCM24511_00528 [Saitozyma sp. JCM 24511]|nr:hypothetical protein JCM24511_00528 [Saitozyma sp. JCM 24511]